MPGGFSSGFSTGFGPVAASGVLSAALIKYLKILDYRDKKEIYMETIRISGPNASGQLNGIPTMAYKIDSIEIDVPLDEVGTTDPCITVSGSLTGTYTYHSSVSPNLRFQPNETVYMVTCSGMTSEYTAIVNYVAIGDMSCYMQTSTARNARGEVVYYPTPWRFRS